MATGSVPAREAVPSATRRVSAAERRAQYLRVAADLVTEQGADAVTMEAVAAGAAVNKALLYRQFSNRAELLLTLFEQETGELDRRVATAIEGADDFDAKVRAWITAWFSYMGRRGTLYYRLVSAVSTIASGSAAPPHRERQRRLVKQNGRWFSEEFGLPLEQGNDVASILYAGLTGAIERWVASPTAATRRRLEETFVQMVLGGLGQLAASTSAPAVSSNGGGGAARARRPPRS